MAEPKISLNKLGEYMTASPARRRRIVEDQINPKTFLVARYSDAREYIINYILGKSDEEELLDAAEKLRTQKYESDFTAQDKNLSADAIEDFLEVADQIPSGYVYEKAANFESSVLKISGVTVSIRPDIYIKNDNNKIVGTIKFHFPKTNPLNPTSGEYVATALRTFLQEQESETVDHKLCLILDIPSENLIASPKATKKECKISMQPVKKSTLVGKSRTSKL
jgi:hypothetical protein